MFLKNYKNDVGTKFLYNFIIKASKIFSNFPVKCLSKSKQPVYYYSYDYSDSLLLLLFYKITDGLKNLKKTFSFVIKHLYFLFRLKQVEIFKGD